MASDFAVHEADAAELIKLRNTPTVVFTARINQASFTYPLDELTYDGGTGTYSDIKAGYLCYVGTGAGLRDKGIARIWKSATSTKIYLIPVSSGRIHFAENDYLTVWSFGRQGSKLHLTFLHPTIVYTAQINQSFTGLSNVVELTYDNGSGTLADVLPGMTIAIGTIPGARDIGLYRVRKTPTATVLYINQSPNKKLADDQYITVYDDFRAWKKEIYTSGTDITKMDWDIELNDENIGVAVLRVGPEVAVLFRDAITGEVTFTPPSPALSACYDGTTISSYLYEFSGSASSDNLTSGTGEAYAVYDTAGEYRWSVTAIDSIGRTTKTYRRVIIDPATIPFELEDCGGKKDDGWSFSITCYDDVTKAEVIEGALCVLYSEDWYNGVKGSIGKITGYENIVTIGRIDGESIDFDSEDGSVTFSAYSVNNILSKLQGSPIELTHTTSAPTTWKEIEDMTVDKALAHVLTWTTTLPLFMDCFFTENTIQQNIFVQPEGGILDALNYISEKIFAGVQNNNLGQMYVQIDPQMMSDSDRAALPVVMDITDTDTEDERNIERKPVGSAVMVEMSAMISYDGSMPYTVYSRATGGDFGDSPSYDDYSVIDQDECNYLSGRLLAIANNEYENIEISMPSNNRLFDVCPPMLGTLSFTEVKRGIVFDEQAVIPRSVKITYDANAGAISIDLEFEVVVTSIDGDTYYPPPVSDIETDDFESGLDYGGASFPDNNLGDWFPDSIPSPSTLPSAPCGSQFNSFSAAWDKSELRGDGDLIARCYFPCKVRPKSYNPASPSKVLTGGTALGDAAGKLTLYGIKGGSRVVTADSNFEFDPLSPVEVDGFELELDAGLGTIVTYASLDIAGTGVVDANNATGVVISNMVDGQYYSVQSAGGPFNIRNPDDNAYWGQVRYGIVWSGILGYREVDAQYADAGGFYYAEKIGSLYARVYVKKVAGDFTYRVFDYNNDGYYADNIGQSSYILRNAVVNGRRVLLGSATIQNVCPI